VGTVDPGGKTCCPRARRTTTAFADPFVPEGGLKGLLLQTVEQELVVAQKGEAVQDGVGFTAQAAADSVFQVRVAVQANQRPQAGQELASNRSNIVFVPAR